MQIVRNPKADPSAPYKEEQLAVVSLHQARHAEQSMRRCPLYERTPLHSFDLLASRLGVSRVFVKDETERLGLTSFKALGGAYAVLMRAGFVERSFAPQGNSVRASATATFATATDGNHGISVAAGAWLSGAHSVCFLPPHVQPLYADAMRLLGARIIHTEGNYDSAVAQAAKVARENGWTLISDTTPEAFDAATHDVLAGYGVMVGECVGQLAERAQFEGRDAVTHVFIQGGVGGLAAAFAGGFWERLGSRRPVFVIVEPRRADCLYQSARKGDISNASGDLETSMGMLSCGRPSRMAWTILRSAGDFFMTIEDEAAAAGMDAFAAEPAIRARATTASGAAGIAGLIELAASTEARQLIGLNERSVVLTVCSEQLPKRAALEALIATRPQAVRA
jgi:diaminopropionate ammonia-lyase